MAASRGSSSPRAHAVGCTSKCANSQSRMARTGEQHRKRVRRRSGGEREENKEAGEVRANRRLRQPPCASLIRWICNRVSKTFGDVYARCRSRRPLFCVRHFWLRSWQWLLITPSQVISSDTIDNCHQQTGANRVKLPPPISWSAVGR
eukprot:103939-Pleurochrysis_carterae.AAC.1